MKTISDFESVQYNRAHIPGIYENDGTEIKMVYTKMPHLLGKTQEEVAKKIQLWLPFLKNKNTSTVTVQSRSISNLIVQESPMRCKIWTKFILKQRQM